MNKSPDRRLAASKAASYAAPCRDDRSDGENGWLGWGGSNGRGGAGVGGSGVGSTVYIGLSPQRLGYIALVAGEMLNIWAHSQPPLTALYSAWRAGDSPSAPRLSGVLTHMDRDGAPSGAARDKGGFNSVLACSPLPPRLSLAGSSPRRSMPCCAVPRHPTHEGVACVGVLSRRYREKSVRHTR